MSDTLETLNVKDMSEDEKGSVSSNGNETIENPISPVSELLTLSRTMIRNAFDDLDSDISKYLHESVLNEEAENYEFVEELRDEIVGKLNELRNNLKNNVFRAKAPAAVNSVSSTDTLYSFVSVLGKGTFGVTHKMKYSVDGREYAAKVIRVGDLLLSGVRKEDLIAEVSLVQNRVTHPNIVKYYTSYYTRDNSLFNVVMELVVEGSNLALKIKDAEVSWTSKVKWFTQLVAVLCYLHDDVGIQHRDIKPENILLDVNGDIKLKLKVNGVKHVSIVQSNATSSLVNTALTYSSYEKASCMPYDGRDDVWALGCVMAELMTKTRLQDSGGALWMFHTAAVNERRLKLVSECKALNIHYGDIVASMLEPEQSRRCTSQQLFETLSAANVINSVMMASPSWSRSPPPIVSNGSTKPTCIESCSIKDCHQKSAFFTVVNIQGTKIVTHEQENYYQTNTSRYIKVWDVNVGLIATFAMPRGEFKVVGFGPDDRLVVVTQHGMSLLNFQTNVLEKVIDLKCECDHKYLLSNDFKVISLYESGVFAWNLITGVKTSISDLCCFCFDVDSSGRYIAVGHSAGLLHLYSGEDGSLLREIRQHSVVVRFNSNGLLLAAGDSDGKMYVYDVHTGHCLYNLKCYSTKITSISWTSDDKLLTTTGNKKVVSVWHKCTLIDELEHVGVPVYVSVHNESNTIITTATDRTIRKWNIAN